MDRGHQSIRLLIRVSHLIGLFLLHIYYAMVKRNWQLEKLNIVQTCESWSYTRFYDITKLMFYVTGK